MDLGALLKDDLLPTSSYTLHPVSFVIKINNPLSRRKCSYVFKCYIVTIFSNMFASYTMNKRVPTEMYIWFFDMVV